MLRVMNKILIIQDQGIVIHIRILEGKCFEIHQRNNQNNPEIGMPFTEKYFRKSRFNSDKVHLCANLTTTFSVNQR